MPLKQITSSRVHPTRRSMKEGEWRFALTGGKPGRLFHKFSSILHEFWSGEPLFVDGSNRMKKGAVLHIDEIRALGSDGLKLYDDAGVIGSGLFLKDGGDFGVGVDPSYKFSIGSTDGSDQIGIHHDNTDAYFKTTDGVFNFQTDEGTNTDTHLNVRGKGTGSGYVKVYDEARYGYFVQNGTSTFFAAVSGTLFISAASVIHMQNAANANINCFFSSAAGETRELNIYGYKDGDAKRALEIGVGVDAADTASFDGVSNYYFDGFIVLPKASGNGIKIDSTTPTFGWRDLLGQPTALNTGASKPTFAAYRDTLLQFQFAAGDEEYFEFHIPHDYVPGTDIHLHIHWSHIGTFVTGGTVTFEYEISYAKGHNQAAFPASVGTTFNGTASTTQYQHIITEVQISAASPDANQIDSDDLEPDGVIITRFDLNSNDITVSEGAVPDPFVHYVDIHYQSTNIGTKDKAPDFYT